MTDPRMTAHPTSTSSARWGLPVAVGLAAVLSSLAFPSIGQAAKAPSLTASQPLQPAFDPAVRDYSVTCESGPVTFTALSPLGVAAQFGSGRSKGGTLSQKVTLAPGQRVVMTVRQVYAGRTLSYRTYSIRCRPSDLPMPAVTKAPGARLSGARYLTVPRLKTVTPQSRMYIVIYDSNGTPVWWRSTGNSDSIFATMVGPRTLAHFESTVGQPFQGSGRGRWVFRTLGGRVTNILEPAGITFDHHEILGTPEGTWLTMSYEPRANVDLTSVAGPASGLAVDAVVREVSNSGQVLWTWNSKDHIALEEGGAVRVSTIFDGAGGLYGPGGGTAYDLAHINSVEPDGDGYLISLRKPSAVYRILKSTGEVDWKLGGTTTAKSLTVIGDPHGSLPLVGQHDARRLPDGSVSVYDNGVKGGSPQVRPPRVVRYRIDREARTATFVSEFTDPAAATSPCCGNAMRLKGGNWVVSWGGIPYLSEVDSRGRRLLAIEFPAEAIQRSYRIVAVDPKVVPRDEILLGMDRMVASGR